MELFKEQLKSIKSIAESSKDREKIKIKQSFVDMLGIYNYNK